MADMNDKMNARSLGRKNKKGLALSKPPPKAPEPSTQDAQIPGGIGNNSTSDAGTLEIGVEFKLDLRNEDLKVLKELGAGNGGTVSKVMHTATKVVMAKKVIHVDAKKETRKSIVRELHIMHDCTSQNIVNFYGAFLHDSGDVIMCMEYMDCGSLDRISKDFGPVRVDVLGKIAEAILNGLNYLYEHHRIMHRDIKPSNVLVNHFGNIKLCDFGVSGELVNSVAATFVGTSTYMAPERISGSPYSIKSDVWSFGLTLMELAIARFPFDSNDATAGDRASAGPMGILDLLQQIVHEPAPKLPESDAFPPYLHDLIAKCLLKDPEERPTPRQLYDRDMFLQAAKRTPVDLAQWAVQMMERHNRKSHLAPQLSPSTQALLRGDLGSSSSEKTSSTSNPLTSPSRDSTPATQSSRTPTTQSSRTPTSSDIPLAKAPSPKPQSGPQTSTSEPPMSSRITDVNGGTSYHEPAAVYENGYPPRTSSSLGAQQPRSSQRSGYDNSSYAGYSVPPDNGNNAGGFMNSLPIRPAPPSGPLPPPPPGSSREARTPRAPPGPGNSNYQYSDGHF